MKNKACLYFLIEHAPIQVCLVLPCDEIQVMHSQMESWIKDAMSFSEHHLGRTQCSSDSHWWCLTWLLGLGVSNFSTIKLVFFLREKLNNLWENNLRLCKYLILIKISSRFSMSWRFFPDPINQPMMDDNLIFCFKRFNYLFKNLSFKFNNFDLNFW